METMASAPEHINSTAAHTEKGMDIQAPLMAVYIPTVVPSLPAHPHALPPATEAATLRMAAPPLYSMETLPYLTLHMAGGLQSQAGLSLAAVSPSTSMRPAGKHVCPHCGRDCMKPSVLEKHLRCHTGERPYPCTTCGISFKTQSNLYKHKRTQAHARLSSESDHSCPGSLDSMSRSRETFTLSLEESDSVDNDTTLPTHETASPTRTGMVVSVRKPVSVCRRSERSPAGHDTTEPHGGAKATIEEEKRRTEDNKMLPRAGRHLPLQRQEATRFSRQWESSGSKGKPQSHESTDSGFSESSDHHPSPGSVSLDHSMDSPTESTEEHLQQAADTQTPSELGHAGQEAKHTAREQEQKTLEERISRLISENTAIVEDKRLENVRPRKTVLSKQGSIDLPVPYTYKDSLHFDMRNCQTQNVGLQRPRTAGVCSSVPTQHSTTREHATLVRSSSLPFSVSLWQPERSASTSCHHSDYLTLMRSRSSGQINPTGFTSGSVSQQTSTHRPLVRQVAVDCNHATDGLYSSTSVEDACAAGLGCDRDNGGNCGEPSNRKFRRKKAQKFAYSKWYVYGEGTFKKLYDAEKGGDGVVKGRKCLTNPDHEVVQGSQKRLPGDHKEATTGSAVNLTSSSARACRPECPPANQPHDSAVDYNPNTGHLPTSPGSLTPLRRNLSLSVLPLPLVGSPVRHKAGSLSRAEGGRLVKRKHTDCESHIPSDRKKQEADDRIFPTETDPNAPTHPPPSVPGSAPQQTAIPSHMKLQDNLKHTQLKGLFFPPSMTNASTTSTSTSPATSSRPAAGASFLPKYQLKLPNGAEPVSKPLPRAADKSSVTDSCNMPSAPPVSSLMQRCDIKETNVFSSTQSQLLLPCTAVLIRQAESSSLASDAKSSLAVVHRQFATATVTASCMVDYPAGLCSSSIQPTKSTGGLPATPTITTASNQTSAATNTASSQGQTDHPLSYAQLWPASNQSGPVNAPHVSSSTRVAPRQIVPFDQTQPPAQNVFHVHTADLQICLQIISDEQLALIEPQIERQAGGDLPQRRDAGAAAQEGIRKRAQSLEIHGQEKDHHQKELTQSESLVTLSMDRIKPQLSGHGNFLQTRVRPDSSPPEAQGSLQRPQHGSDVNAVTSVVLPAASLKCQMPDGRVSQGGSASQTVSGQAQLNTTRLSSSTVGQNSMRADILEGTTKPEGETSVHDMSALESGESHSSPQGRPGWTSGASWAGEPSGSAPSCSVNKREAPGQLNPLASVRRSNPVEPTSSGTLHSSRGAGVRRDSERPRSNSTAPLQERPRDIPAVLTDTQSPTAGLLEGCAAHRDPRTQGHGGTPGLPGTGGRGPGGDKNRGLRTDEEPGQRGQAESTCRHTCLQAVTKPAGEEDTRAKMDSLGTPLLSEQHLPTTQPGVYPHRTPQQTPDAAKYLESPAPCGQASFLHSPRPSLEPNNSYISQPQRLCDSNSSRRIETQAQSTGTRDAASSQTDSSPQQTFSNQDRITLCVQRGSTASVASCATAKLASGGHLITSPDTRPSPSTNPGQVSCAAHDAAGMTSDPQAPNTNTPDDNALLPSRPFSYPEMADYQDTEDKAPNEYPSHSGGFGRSDISDKHQSLFFSGPLQGHPAVECLSGGVKPVQSCQDYTEDTSSSSDDEGKLIIEL